MRKIPNANNHIFKTPGIPWASGWIYLTTPNKPAFGTTTTISPTDPDITPSG